MSRFLSCSRCIMNKICIVSVSSLFHLTQCPPVCSMLLQRRDSLLFMAERYSILYSYARVPCPSFVHPRCTLRLSPRLGCCGSCCNEQEVQTCVFEAVTSSPVALSPEVALPGHVVLPSSVFRGPATPFSTAAAPPRPRGAPRSPFPRPHQHVLGGQSHLPHVARATEPNPC